MKTNNLIISFVLLLLCSNTLYATTRLTLWHGQGSNESFWQNAVAEFELKYPAYQVDISSLPRKELNSSLTVAVLNNEAPDMVLLQSDLLGLKSLFKLSQIPTTWLTDTTSSEMDFFIRDQGAYYGIPISYGNHMLLYYNKNIVHQVAGSWQALKEQASTLPDEVNILGINYRSAYTFVTFWHAFGDRLVHNDQINLNNKSTIDTLNFFQENTANHIFNPLCDYSCVSGAFFAGKYAYAINGDWEFENAKSELGDALGIAQLPSINGKAMRSMKSALVLAFPGHEMAPKKRRGLEKFSHFIQSPEFAKNVFHQLHAMPANKDIKDALVARADTSYQTLIEQLKHSRPMPPSAAMVSAWDSIAKGFRLFLDGHGSAEDIARYMQGGADYERTKVLNREQP